MFLRLRPRARPTRRALSNPLHGCELTFEEAKSILATTGGEVLLEDCGFERFDPPPPADTGAGLARDS